MPALVISVNVYRLLITVLAEVAFTPSKQRLEGAPCRELESKSGQVSLPLVYPERGTLEESRILCEVFD